MTQIDQRNRPIPRGAFVRRQGVIFYTANPDYYRQRPEQGYEVLPS